MHLREGGREREKEREKQWESESTYHSWREDTQPQVKLLCPHSEPLSSLKLSCLQALSQPVDLSERKISSSICSFVMLLAVPMLFLNLTDQLGVASVCEAEALTTMAVLLNV